MTRLSARVKLRAGLGPHYDPASHGVGIVHLGLGAFHKAHQAAYTDTALAKAGGDWRIVAVSLRSRDAVEALSAQDGRYTLIERGTDAPAARVIGSVARALTGADGTGPVLAAMADRSCRIVTLTVTEKAYGLDRAGKGCDPLHPAVAADLAMPDQPKGVLGLLVRALGQRFAAGLEPFTVLCCDNLPQNGHLLRNAAIDFARRIDPGLAGMIEARVAFPCSMVDRITPTTTSLTLSDARNLIGFEDHAAVETEPFHQWVIEDDFPTGRPAWDLAGAVFVSDVMAYEDLKLRMLNGTHSMLAYAGFHAGYEYVREVMADPALTTLVQRHLRAAAATLGPLPDIDTDHYADALMTRFANPAIAHETLQIAMDGTQKLPQRIFAPALCAQKSGQNLRPFAFATALWLRHISGATHDREGYKVQDPRADELALVANAGCAAKMVEAAAAMEGFMPHMLRADSGWLAQITGILSDCLTRPMSEVLAEEARNA
ncbi:mannitol dehydrogenase family protein [Falsirhodobacter sp. alg1]|uniref:mannitol dehydrogenase family protein n=1 Tax=Falsirhodobacter sp. alg1 TaxID=1472418 RepID=UPI0005ED649B|nr:mannitol dehydrogenase family protein [Falsirhodobacter sp. alg1]